MQYRFAKVTKVFMPGNMTQYETVEPFETEGEMMQKGQKSKYSQKGRQIVGQASDGMEYPEDELTRMAARKRFGTSSVDVY